MGMGESKMLQSNLLISEIVGFVGKGKLPSREPKKRKWRKVKEGDKMVRGSVKSKRKRKTKTRRNSLHEFVG
jgi:hypothetical protein